MTALEYLEKILKKLGEERVKSDPDFMKKWADDFSRAYYEELIHAVFKCVLDHSYDFYTEADKIDEKYLFNEDMKKRHSSSPYKYRDVAEHLYKTYRDNLKEAQLFYERETREMSSTVCL